MRLADDRGLVSAQSDTLSFQQGQIDFHTFRTRAQRICSRLRLRLRTSRNHEHQTTNGHNISPRHSQQSVIQKKSYSEE